MRCTVSEAGRASRNTQALQSVLRPTRSSPESRKYTWTAPLLLLLSLSPPPPLPRLSLLSVLATGRLGLGLQEYQVCDEKYDDPSHDTESLLLVVGPAAGASELLAGETNVQPKQRGKDPEAGCIAGRRVRGRGGAGAAAAPDAVVAPTPRRHGPDGRRGRPRRCHSRGGRRARRRVRCSPQRRAPVGGICCLVGCSLPGAVPRATPARAAATPAVRVHVQGHDRVLCQHGLAGRAPRRALAHPAVQARPAVQVAAPACTAAEGPSAREGGTRLHGTSLACICAPCRSQARGPDSPVRARSRGHDRLLHRPQTN